MIGVVMMYEVVYCGECLKLEWDFALSNIM